MSDRVRMPFERCSPPNFFSSFVLFVLSIINDEPRCIKEAFSSKECKLWKKEMVE